MFKIIRGENATNLRNRQNFALKMNVGEGLGKTSTADIIGRRFARKLLNLKPKQAPFYSAP
ncbi:MAG: hypothetical protein NXI12_08135 [Alphaproteobacteria bacterium]|nr:hypothetical protein [Alphaproteobacteria bacterium]